ncbi:toxin-antitoxin system YwqK family antitoxin [Subsaximicrobium wynnwilliamsii]|nr:toxin-antitoxin system YwqK family antitoxin [Subsaximicrobium wynnwilliamsii]
MKFRCFVGLVFAITITYGQEQIPYIDYETVFPSVMESVEKEDYDAVIKQLNLINKNDSTYCSVLTSKSYYYILQEKFDDAIATTNEGLSLNCSSQSNLFFFMNKGASYASKKEYTNALDVYETGLELYPRNSKLWFNKGIALENLEQIEGAIDAYQKAIIYNPLYRNAHLRLGDICYKQQLMSQALMCYNMGLILELDTDRAFTLLKQLNEMVADKNSNEPKPGLVVSPDDSAFKNLDLILNNRVALNANYPIDNEIDISLVKQNHALLQQLKSIEANGGFWDAYYLPFFQWISASDHFDDFTYTLSYSIKNEEYQKLVEKKSDEVTAFIEAYVVKWFGLFSQNDKDAAGYLYEDGAFTAEGTWDKEYMVDDWTFYDTDGKLSAKGSYNQKGERIKTWTWFHENGKLKEISRYADGKLNGEHQFFHEDGSPYIRATYKDDAFEGEYTYYLEAGGLKQKKYFHKGELKGKYLAYFDVGESLVEYDADYNAGIIVGDLTEYYADGSVFSVINFKDNKRDGKEIQYYRSGKKSMEADYKAGDLHGSYITFFENGKIREQGQTEAGYYEGNWMSYFSDGTLSSEYAYKNGDFDDLFKSYDTDGVLASEFKYRKGEIIGYKFFDKAGNILSEATKKGGDFFFEGYHPNGNKSAEGNYDISGGKIGDWKFYNYNAVLTDVGHFEEGEPVGSYTTFNAFGEVSQKSEYDKANARQYYQGFYPNGQLQSQGWYKNGLQHGEWHSYFIDGALDAINFYHKDQLHGTQKDFGVDGKLVGHTKFNYGDLVEEVYYDVNEKPYQTFDFDTDKKSYSIVTNYQNGNKQTEITYVNGIKQGPYKHFSVDGKVIISGNYNNDNLNGEWQWYYDDGSLRVTEGYENGNRHGASKRYYQNGQLEDDYFYEHGNTQGSWKSYYGNGELFSVSAHANDLIQGRKEFYSPDGKLQVIRFYSDDVLIGYSYLNSDGTEKEMIPITNETGVLNAFFDNGKASRTTSFVNGKIEGDYMAYYYDGQLENKLHYEKGEQHGKDKKYYPNGQLNYSRSYNYGMLNGPFDTYYPNGKLKESINYLNDEKHGEANYYDETGTLIKTYYYANGDAYDSKS